VIQLNGIDQHSDLAYQIGDTLVLDICPIAGNNGLPAGCPSVTNNQVQRVSFVATSAGVIARNGSDFFKGFVFRIQINNAQYPLLDNDYIIRDTDNQAIATWQQSPSIQLFILNSRDTWQHDSNNYPLSPLLLLINKNGANTIVHTSDLFHQLIHNVDIGAHN
jgi:hypothetical protein